MSMQATGAQQTSARHAGLVALFATLVTLVVFSSALLKLVTRWIQREEYSHGFLIPIVAAWLLWTRRDALRESLGPPVWAGSIMILLALAMHIMGELSATPTLSQVGFVLALAGLVLALGGYSLLRTAGIPIFFLLFAIPAPDFVVSTISLRLQLISSELGAAFIRMFQIPVYRDGNIIDLGYYSLQVVDACSGLRYMYPLLSLSFLAAYMFHAPFWQRVIVFLSSIPISIAMNSIRIGLVGVTVNYWGTQAAEGFLHFFEGWVIFLACAGILVLEMWFLARMSGKTLSDVVRFPILCAKLPLGQRAKPVARIKFAASLVILCLAGIVTFFISSRAEVIPDRSRFATFPTRIGHWQGQTSLLDPQVERGLVGLDDYILSDYKESDGKIINLYVGYYASQRKDGQPHSPSDCIPASGWRITKLEPISYRENGAELPLNRAVIEKNSTEQLVYYWFDERGRKIANEHLARWYLHLDTIFMNRTDGALVRLVTQIQRDETERDADERLRAFIGDALPILSEYLPAKSTSQAEAVRVAPKDSQL